MTQGNNQAINTASMNMLLEQTAMDTPESKKIKRTVPDNILMMVEQERLRRFEIIMDIPPTKFIELHTKKLLPWM